MEIQEEQIIRYRMRVHHLDGKLPQEGLLEAAGACGLQNSPPGAWETALFNRLHSCTLNFLRGALYHEKTLLQAWSFRGAPVVFPAAESDVFLTALCAQQAEQPWIYTKGVSAALDVMGMPFDELLARVRQAAGYLDAHTVKSKELLDRTLAEIVQKGLPPEKQALWRSPSLYGGGGQTLGEAVVSFLLRPCSFLSLVVFGERQGPSPTFTSFQNWLGRPPVCKPEAGRRLVQKFLHSYGPADKASFLRWLGCSPPQAARLWDAVREEMDPVTVRGKTRYMLSRDIRLLQHAEKSGRRLILLGPHDPYLDVSDKDLLLKSPALQKTVWKTAANPGAVLRDGRVAGRWKTHTLKDRLELEIALFEPFSAKEQEELQVLAEEYAAFRLLRLTACKIKS
ncbi:MAG: winged helix DNA-binding domain-containing protein [Oscillospiraceae bacterium]|nr:winged helix DNA-binding domain-containing protein [Oscillospiraceae bacterium]